LAEATIRIGYPVIRLSGYPVKILDLGTGCGCIAISLAKFLPGTKITALDISDKTLELAKENAELHGVKIKFLKMDLTGNWQTGNRITDNFDIIVSNPPYIPSRQIDKLQPEVRREPRVALDAGRDGLDFYRRIAVQAPAYLKAGGFLILEMGFGQRDRIEDILQKSGNFKIKEVNRDYSGIERVIAAQKEV
jgi:release factor glutamine methyltransferase